jgi:hypothetical protein
MDRQQFFDKAAALDETHLRKALWNLYWRGSATMRERIEAELDPVQHEHRQRIAKEPADPQLVLDDVGEFVKLARSGAYLAGDRRVTPRERTRWRFTFQRLIADARDALRARDPGPAEIAVEQLVDLACETRDRDYFRSDDPVEAAKFVVSDTVALLWAHLQDRYGFAEFAERAAPQLIRWESKYGWTRTGWGRTREKESSLASVAASMLLVPDTLASFTDRYLDALDQVARDDAVKPNRSWQRQGWDIEQRTAALAEWHLLLLGRLVDSEDAERLDRLARHPALAGPELTFLQARLAHQNGDLGGACRLVHESLLALPGHEGFLSFAVEIGAPLPPAAQRAFEDRARWQLTAAQAGSQHDAEDEPTASSLR